MLSERQGSYLPSRIVANDAGNPIVYNVGQQAFAQEDWRTRRQLQYADIGVLNVTVFRPTELGPLGIVDLAGKDINSVSLRRKSEEQGVLRRQAGHQSPDALLQ